MANKYNFTINGQSFRSATAALGEVKKLRKASVKIETIRVNNEPLLLSELELESDTERQVKAHNKRQGL